ncbi:formylglycine-generating enzyme family protein [Neogemmobacter tilapiae]|nr:formylglycine-generating enzyme family protein [Gemmobacter tilapiae]
MNPLTAFKECDACPEMIVIPLGTFMMGATPEESRNPYDFYGENALGRMRGPDELNIIPHEHPRHPVEMDIPYAIARSELTYAEWMACVDDGGCSHNPDHRVLTPTGYVTLGPDHPVIDVSYLDSLEYVAWLNSQVGAEVYRLPTEAEWEYAARAGTETPFAQGEELTSEQANFSRGATENLLRNSENPARIPRPDLMERDMPVPVGDLDAANGWGLRHMSGNVAELTLSCWSDEHIGLGTDSGYLANAKAQASCLRVSKGGDFGTAMDGLRSAARNRPTEDSRRNYSGFRIVRELANKEDE